MGQINVIPPHITHPEKEFRTIVLPHPLPEQWNHFLEQNSWRIIDQYDQQCEELKKIAHFSKNPVNDRKIPSNYILYPWRKTAVRLLTKEDFITVRTSRNHYKISPAEQNLLGQKTIGVVGLSVGQSVALTLAMERSVGRLKLADFDTLDLSNLNRLRASVLSLAEPKSHIVAREIAELDPYLEVELFEEGLTKENAKDFFDGDHPLDLVVEECDSLEIKMLVREEAQKRALPVLMDTSDRGMLDIERYDLDPKYPIFHGITEGTSSEGISQMEPTDKLGKILNLAGIETGSTRLKYSITQLGKTVPTWPQLASSVTYGGGFTADISRRVLLGEDVPSGRYYLSAIDQIRGGDHYERSSLLTPFHEESWLRTVVLPQLPKESSLHHFVEGFLNGEAGEMTVQNQDLEEPSALFTSMNLENTPLIWRLFSPYLRSVLEKSNQKWMLNILNHIPNLPENFYDENPNPFLGSQLFDSTPQKRLTFDSLGEDLSKYYALGAFCAHNLTDYSVNWFYLIGEFFGCRKGQLEEGKVPLIIQSSSI